MDRRAELEQLLERYTGANATDQDREQLFTALRNEADAELLRQMLNSHVFPSSSASRSGVPAAYQVLIPHFNQKPL